MARTNIGISHVNYPWDAAHGAAVKAKLDEHDTALDALEGTTDAKASCLCATTANHGLTGLAAIDGVTPVAGNRILAKNQTAPAENGIYVAAAGAWSRATDANTSAMVTSGMRVHVSEGTINADTWWFISTNDPITLGTTALTFTKEPTLAELASTATGKGSALLGVEDAGGYYGSGTVEGCLQEICADLASVLTGDGASRIGLEDAEGLVSGTNLETVISADIAMGNGLLAMAPVRRVRAVTGANLASFAGVPEALDGLTLVAGDRVLVAAQTVPAENGIYVVGTVALGVADWTRAADMPAAAVIPNGTIIVVDAGTAGANSAYRITNAGAITVGATGLTFTRLASGTDKVDGYFVANVANANTTGGVEVVHRINCADAAGNTDVVLTYKTLVLDAYLIKTGGAGGAGDTVQVLNAGSAITNAMDINVADTTVVRMGTYDDANAEIAAGGTLRVTTVKPGASNAACTVVVRGVRVA